MSDSIEYDLICELDAEQLWYLYERKAGKDIVCPLCSGMHGDNTLCQRND